MQRLELIMLEIAIVAFLATSSFVVLAFLIREGNLLRRGLINRIRDTALAATRPTAGIPRLSQSCSEPLLILMHLACGLERDGFVVAVHVRLVMVDCDRRVRRGGLRALPNHARIDPVLLQLTAQHKGKHESEETKHEQDEGGNPTTITHPAKVVEEKT